jgi:dihydrofolate synthase/folylpolyglutamate synthase
LNETSFDDLDAWLDYVARENWQTAGMGLSRMETMVERLQLRRPGRHVITVAGTNGKGTTCLALERLILLSGSRVGTTLSPHIDRFNERIRIQGEELSDDEICKAFAAVERARGDLTLTYFEYSTLAALWTFAKSDLDFAILEIGLGGRLDAFNVIDPDTAVITSIGYDHEELLGPTLEDIGREKAGIFRAGQKVILGSSMPASVLGCARALKLQPLRLGQDFHIGVDPASRTWRLTDNEGARFESVPLGQCAPSNLALAWMAARTAGVMPTQNQPSRLKWLQDVSATLKIPGRMDTRVWRGRIIVRDVAHNPDGIGFLCRELADRGLSPKLLCCAMLMGKAHRRVYETLSNQFTGQWLLFDSQGDRAMSAELLRDSIGVSELATVPVSGLPERWLSATEPGDVILVFGSFSAVEQSSRLFDSPLKDPRNIRE